MLGKIEGRRRRDDRRQDEMVGWHHLLNGHEFEQILEGSRGQRSLACQVQVKKSQPLLSVGPILKIFCFLFYSFECTLI